MLLIRKKNTNKKERTNHKIEKQGEIIESADEEVVDALVGLGYSLGQIREVIRKIPASIESTEEKIKAGLKFLSK